MSRKVLFFIKIKSAKYSQKGDELCLATECDENNIRLIVDNHLKQGGYKPHYDSIRYVFKEGQLFVEGTAYTVESNNPNVESLFIKLRKRVG